MARTVMDQSDLRFVMQLDSPPGQRCKTDATCPGIFLLSGGSYAVVGRDMTNELVARLPNYANVASYERIIVIPRATLVSAREHIPIC